METVEQAEESREKASMRPGPANGLPRFEGARAEIAHWSSTLLDVSGGEDPDREREASTKLARLYVSRGTDLDAAVRVARVALELGEDPALRADLAGWLVGLGDPVAAARELRNVASTQTTARARTLVRASVLLSRSKLPEEAAGVLREAAAADPADPLAPELLGAISAWAPEAVSPVEGAKSYLEAAKRRAAAGDKAAAFEDQLRAFELAPASADAARAALRALIEAGRPLAADELASDHARALLSSGHADRARSARTERLGVSLESGNVPRALAAAIDLGLESDDNATADRIEDALGRAGLYELLAVRLDVLGRRRHGVSRARCFDSLSKVLAGSLGAIDDSIDALIEAASSDATSPTSLASLREHAARTHDPEPLVVALTRIAESDPPADADGDRDRLARLAAAQELADLADTSLDDPELGVWAADRLERLGDIDRDRERAVAIRQRLDARLVARRSELAHAEETSTGDAVATVERTVELLGRAPVNRGRRIAALATAARAGHAPAATLRALDRAIAASPSGVDAELYESVLRARLEAPLSRRDHVKIRATLARMALERPRGEAQAALEIVPLAELPELDAWAGSVILFFSLAAGRASEAARAFEALASADRATVRAVLLAAAADYHVAAGEIAEARRTGEAAVAADGRSARACASLSRAAADGADREAAVALERAISVVAPRAWLCEALARCLEQIGEGALSYAWTQRWAALAPGDGRAVRELMRRSTLGRDAARITDALIWVLAQPDPPEDRRDAFLEALTLLFRFDKTKGGQVGRRALDVFGASDDVVRERLVELADEHADAGLAIAALERWVAAAKGPHPDVLIAIARRRLAAGDADGAARLVGRAVTNGADARAALDLCDEVDRAASASGGLSSDGLVAMGEARVRSLGALLAEEGPASTSAPEARLHVAEAWRLVGALRWDLAADPRGSEQALFAAAALDADHGLDRYASDLFELAEGEEAAAALFERLELLTDSDPSRLPLSLATARAAAERGLSAFSLDAALAALALDPTHAEAITLAESQAPLVEGGENAIDRLYDDLATRALGVFGRRAAHYRASRQLERIGARDLALKHALAALEAVPAEAMTWLLLLQLVDPEIGSEDAVSLLERIAAASPPDDRGLWLKRALELTGRGRAGLERRIDVLIRGLSGAPDATFVRSLDETLTALDASGGLPELTIERVVRVAASLLKKLEGPDGARVAALFARVLARYGALPQAHDALDKAIFIDGDVEVFEQLWDSARTLAEDGARTVALIEKLTERTKSKHALIGPPLLRLGSRLADAVGDSRASADFLAEAERREEPTQSRSSSADPFADPLFDSVPPDAPDSKDSSWGENDAPAAAPSAAPAEEASASFVSEASAPAAEPETPAALAAPSTPPLAPGSTPPEAPPIPVPAPRRSGRRLQLDVESTPLPDMPAPRPPGESDGFDALFIEKEEPASDEMLEAQETAARERGDHEEVSALLHRRITTSNWAEQVRILKLRRAVVLEQRLSRVDDAKKELLEILAESPDDKSALSFLADMHDKRGEHLEAAALWDRVASAPGVTDDELLHAATKSARAYFGAGDAPRALAALEPIHVSHGEDVQVLKLRLELLRATGDAFSLVMTADQLLANGKLPDQEAAALLVEASRAAAAQGDEAGAVIRARRAARLVPTDAAAVLELACLEYRARGMGTPREAEAAVEALGAIGGSLEESQIELQTFLLAEALDVIQGGGAGMRELSKRHAEIGTRPLVALGIAERLARSRSFAEAVPMFEAALAGDLRGLRNPARVATAAFDAALNGSEPGAAKRFLEEIERHPELNHQLDRRRRELRAFDEDPVVAKEALTSLVVETTGLTKARFLHRLAGLTAEGDLEIAVALYEEAIGLARRDRSLAEKIRSDLVELLEKHGPESYAVPPGAPASDAPPSSQPASSIPIGSDGGDRSALTPPSKPPEPGELAIGKKSSHQPPPLPAAGEHGPSTDPQPTLRAAGSTPPVAERTDDTPLVAVMTHAQANAPSADSYRPTMPEAPPRPPPTPVPSSDEPAKDDDVAASSPVAPRQSLPTPSVDAPLTPPADTTRSSMRDVVPELPSEPPRPRRTAPISASITPPSRPTLQGSEEEDLFAELAAGDLDSGAELAERIASGGGARTRDLVVVRRHIAVLVPGEIADLTLLRDAARVDRNEAYARALDHVLAIGTSEVVEPPPIWAQPREPELLANWMFRDLNTRETEALGIIWATGMLRRELASYQLGPSDRVPLTVATPLGEAYSEIAGLLGSPRPLFHKRTDGAAAVTVGLLAQPAILVAGEVPARSAELAFLLGAAHSSCNPELLLAAHLPETNLRRLFEAIAAAFGPLEQREDNPTSSTAAFRAEVARVAGDLWQLVSPRSERRLRELAESPLDWQAARAVARRAMRRAGLLASGDLGAALRVTFEDLGHGAPDFTAPDALANAARTHREVADLLRFATSSEYAESRWQPIPPSSLRRS